ncbi:MAG: hypothetical protein ACK4JF_10490 [Methylohalobius sp.]
MLWLLLALPVLMPQVLPSADEGFVPVTATFQDRAANGSAVQNYRPRQTEGQWIKVSGFADSKYFYGQLQLLGNRKVAGYLYFTAPPKHEPIDPLAPDFPRQKQDPIRQEQVYVYGELVRPGEFRVFDKQGALYRLLAVKDKR